MKLDKGGGVTQAVEPSNAKKVTKEKAEEKEREHNIHVC